MDCAIEFDNVGVTLDGVQILDGITAHVPQGSSAAIIGPNGAGKTTLLLAMLGQVPYSGTIRLDGTHRPHPRIGYVPQRFDFDRGLPITVLDALAMDRQRRPLFLGTRRRVRDEAHRLLVRVKAEHLATRRLGALSGGELQRVLLALALQQRPDVLILDEPSSGVDIGGGSLLCQLLDTLQLERGFTRIMVSHDLSMVVAHSDYVICLNRRVLGEGPTRATLTGEVLAATFGVHIGLADLSTIPPQSLGQACDWPRRLEERRDD